MPLSPRHAHYAIYSHPDQIDKRMAFSGEAMYKQADAGGSGDSQSEGAEKADYEDVKDKDKKES